MISRSSSMFLITFSHPIMLSIYLIPDQLWRYEDHPAPLDPDTSGWPVNRENKRRNIVWAKTHKQSGIVHRWVKYAYPVLLLPACSSPQDWAAAWCEWPVAGLVVRYQSSRRWTAATHSSSTPYSTRSCPSPGYAPSAAVRSWAARERQIHISFILCIKQQLWENCCL